MVSEPDSVGLLRQAIEDIETVMVANTLSPSAEVAAVLFPSLDTLAVLILSIKLV